MSLEFYGDNGWRRNPSTQVIANKALWILFLLCDCAFVALIVGTRGPAVGTDTHNYAQMFRMLQGSLAFFTEPGFVLLTYGFAQLGIGVVGYQTALFVTLLLTVVLATRKYYHYLGRERGYQLFLAASLMMLFVSPFFLNAAINGIRQGLSAFIVFSALLAFERKQWWQFVLLGALATSFHVSSLSYLAFAPLLLLRERYILVVGLSSFIAYCFGLTKVLVQVLVPSAYHFVMHYDIYSQYTSGVRLDFALFSLAFFLIPYASAKLTYSSYAPRIKRSSYIYLITLLPFFAVGWGNFSNRYLFVPWMFIAIMAAMVITQIRVPLLRSPVVIGTGLLLSSVVLYSYIYIIPLASV